jgi:hypothetical protein
MAWPPLHQKYTFDEAVAVFEPAGTREFLCDQQFAILPTGATTNSRVPLGSVAVFGSFGIVFGDQAGGRSHPGH